MIDSISDLEALSLTIYGEARGEPIEGQIAVGNVIRNRTNHGASFKDVCLAARQFSCWDESDPNRPLLNEMIQKLIYGHEIDDIIWNQCLWIAKGIINNNIVDNTKRAKNYLTSRLFEAALPSWAKHPIDPIQVGHQIFFNV